MSLKNPSFQVQSPVAPGGLFNPSLHQQAQTLMTPYIPAAATINLQGASSNNGNGRIVPITQVYQLQPQLYNSCANVAVVSSTSQPPLNGFTTSLPTIPQTPQMPHQPFTIE